MQQSRLLPYLLIAPSMVFLAVFFLVPLVQTIALSFQTEAGVSITNYFRMTGDLNFGTADGRSCAASVIDAVVDVARTGACTHVVNGRFKGGYITRHHGAPFGGVHAIQLEMSQRLYMQEDAPFAYEPTKAQALQPLLQRMLAAGLAQVQALAAR